MTMKASPFLEKSLKKKKCPPLARKVSVGLFNSDGVAWCTLSITRRSGLSGKSFKQAQGGVIPGTLEPEPPERRPPSHTFYYHNMPHESDPELYYWAFLFLAGQVRT